MISQSASTEPVDYKGIAKKTFPALIMAAGAAVLTPIGSLVLFWHMNEASDWLNSHDDMAFVIFAVGFGLAAGFACLPTYAASILGGWALGFQLGFPAAMVGFTLGAIIGYGVSRLVVQSRVESVVESRPEWRAVRDAMVGQGFWRTFLIVTLVRVPPSSPFAITNLVMASVQARLLPFMLGTLVGMAPRTGLVVYLSVLAREKYKNATDAANDTPWWYVPVGIALGVMVLVVLGMIAKSALRRVTQAQPVKA